MGDLEVRADCCEKVDVSKWPVRDVMRLPDIAFGERWPVSLAVQSKAILSIWDIAGVGCGDMFVIWDLWVYCGGAVSRLEVMRLTLGLVEPTTPDEANVNEDLLPEFGWFNGERRVMRLQSPCYMRWPELRMPIAANGRRVVLEVEADGGGDVKIWCGLVVSELPKEVPAWVFSGTGKSR